MDKFAYLILAAYLVLSAAGLVLMKSGAGDLSASSSDGILSFSINIKMIIGILFYLMSFLLFLTLIPRFNLSYFYPLSAGILYVIIVGVSVLFLGEKLTTIQAVGSLLILVGVIALNIK